MTPFYRAFRWVVTWLLKGFFRLEPPVDPHGGLSLPGSVIYVGNHPNALIDPGLMFALVQRQVTFLGKAPLFSMPVLGWMMRALGALPVYRKQDDAGQMGKNEGTLTASVKALLDGRALTIFPEGKSHSEPQLQELKTGCARIALEAVRQGTPVRIVPIGLNYQEKNRFRSQVRIEVGAPIDAGTFAQKPDEDPFQAALRLSDAIADALRAITVNLEKWDELPLIQTAEMLYALKTDDAPADGSRQIAFAKVMALLRDEQPERFEALKQQLHAYQRRLELVHAQPGRLPDDYRSGLVFGFVLRNLLWLIALPFWLVGMIVFAVPYWFPQVFVALLKPEHDTVSTVKVLATLLIAPIWWAVLTAAAWVKFGAVAGIAVWGLALPFALFTRLFLERRTTALRDARTFFTLADRKRLHAGLVAEGERIAAEIDQVATELRPRVVGPAEG